MMALQKRWLFGRCLRPWRMNRSSWYRVCVIGKRFCGTHLGSFPAGMLPVTIVVWAQVTFAHSWNDLIKKGVWHIPHLTPYEGHRNSWNQQSHKRERAWVNDTGNGEKWHSHHMENTCIHMFQKWEIKSDVTLPLDLGVLSRHLQHPHVSTSSGGIWVNCK